MVQPEVATLLDDELMVIFSPNDAIQISNTATVALGAVRGLPELARDVVDFTHEREWRCRAHFETNQRWGDAPTDGVPIAFPESYLGVGLDNSRPVLPALVLIVKTESDRNELRGCRPSDSRQS